MSFVLVVILMTVAMVSAQEQPGGQVVEPSNTVEVDNGLANTDLVLAFVVFRHGDRTPDLDELELYPTSDKYTDLFFPYGPKALTNKGKQRSFLVGQYLRRRYDGLVSRLYLSDETTIRTTDFARTKMTALAALAALYPPPPAQMWNPILDWQPVPYNTLPYDEDDLLYYYNCPRYNGLRTQIYNSPQVKEILKPYKSLFKFLTEKTGQNITTPEDVFYLDNLFQALGNVGIPTPKWALEVMSKIKEMTVIEYALEFYNTELIRLASGVLLREIVNASKASINGEEDQLKLHLISAHENNVAALMAAARVFRPHQPHYGSTFSLELRRRRLTGQYGVMAVYSPDAGGSEEILPIEGCGGSALCDFETFLNLTQDTLLSFDDYSIQCAKPI